MCHAGALVDKNLGLVPSELDSEAGGCARNVGSKVYCHWVADLALCAPCARAQARHMPLYMIFWPFLNLASVALIGAVILTFRLESRKVCSRWAKGEVTTEQDSLASPTHVGQQDLVSLSEERNAL